MQDRRLENRCMCAEIVRVDWKTGEDEFRTAEGVLEDISGHGACVEVDEPVPAGAEIMISPPSMPAAVFPGYVLYCQNREYGYIVGIRLAQGHEWSSTEFRPGHLTDVRELIDTGVDGPEGP